MAGGGTQWKLFRAGIALARSPDAEGRLGRANSREIVDEGRNPSRKRTVTGPDSPDQTLNAFIVGEDLPDGTRCQFVLEQPTGGVTATEAGLHSRPVTSTSSGRTGPFGSIDARAVPWLSCQARGLRLRIEAMREYPSRSAGVMGSPCFSR